MMILVSLILMVFLYNIYLASILILFIDNIVTSVFSLEFVENYQNREFSFLKNLADFSKIFKVHFYYY